VQKTQSEVDEYNYPLGKCVVKAFISNDWKFYNSKGHVVAPMEITYMDMEEEY
jgi:hypothetical protein